MVKIIQQNNNVLLQWVKLIQVQTIMKSLCTKDSLYNKINTIFNLQQIQMFAFICLCMAKSVQFSNLSWVGGTVMLVWLIWFSVAPPSEIPGKLAAKTFSHWPQCSSSSESAWCWTSSCYFKICGFEKLNIYPYQLSIIHPNSFSW